MWLRIWACLAALVLATPAHAEWRRAESPNFILYGDLSESALRARILQLEDFDRLLRTLTSGEAASSPARLHIYIVDGRNDLLMVRDLPPNVGGFYTATPDGIAAFVDNRLEDAGNLVLFHEYSHHFLLQSGAAYPAWYVEGFAEYFSTVRFTPRTIDIGRVHPGRAEEILERPWLPMERILSAGPAGLTPERTSAYYAQSWLLVHYFLSNAERQAALARLLPALRRQPLAEALRSATGLSFETLTAELRRYIASRRIVYREMARTSAASPPSVTVTSLPRSADDMIMFEAALRVRIPEDRQADYLRRIREAAARWPDDPLAMRVLAHIELLHGDPAVADRLLDRLLAAAPADGELLYLKGLRWLVAAEGDAPPDDAAANARIWLTRAFTADPDHFPTLYRFAQSLRFEPEFRSDNTRNVLLRARRLAPQVPEIVMNAANLLLLRREYANAIVVLRPLADSPHDPGLAQRARQLIADAEARQRTPEDAPEEDAPASE